MPNCTVHRKLTHAWLPQISQIFCSFHLLQSDMGGFHSFFIESGFFQLVIEEGGRYFSLQIFERANILWGQFSWVRVRHNGWWRTLSTLSLGVSSKQFFTFRDSDIAFFFFDRDSVIAFTLQRSTKSFGQFLLLTKLKVGRSRRLVIIPEGIAKNGWRIFGLELRNMMYPSQYVVGGSGHSKFVAQLHRHNSDSKF